MSASAISSSPSRLSPTPFSISSGPASSTASSPPPTPPQLSDDEAELPPVSVKRLEDEDFEERFQRLKFLLDKSVIYSGVLKQHMESATLKAAFEPPSKPKGRGRKSGKRLRIQSDSEDEGPSKRTKTSDNSSHSTPVEANAPKLQQPALVTGAKLKGYQLEGVEWMISLDQNGISGILADEMGLGKTLQTIAFAAYLRERASYRPFLVVCPLSVLHNWLEEFKKFAPSIPVCVYHGTPVERAELRRTIMKYPEDAPSAVTKPPAHKSATKANGNAEKKKVEKATSEGRRRSGRLLKRTTPNAKEPKRRGSKIIEVKESADRSDESSESAYEEESSDENDDSKRTDARAAFPIILTTYEILMRDRPHLARYHWKYIVVDEGHRLKNFDCRLMREMKKLTSDGRIILSGTPLQNNLAELWSLLNFILPDIFTSIESFQDMFDIPTLQSSLSPERAGQLIHTLHAILKPFLLRRLKVDVEVDLPPKKEYILYAPLTVRQKEVYDVIVMGQLRQFLIDRGSEPTQKPVTDKSTDLDGERKLRKGRKKYIDLDEDDDEWFKRVESAENDEGLETQPKDAAEIGRDYQYRTALKQVNNMKLQNTVMQLRKVCSHPFLFEWPVDPDTFQPVINDELVNVSGKMMVLERLLEELFRRKHKVLIFSQFTTMLDIIEDWATETKKWPLCRIDGSTNPLARREEMHGFQNGGDAPDAPKLFLLSTRAGGLGVNLVAADTVIFYDQDWNPQMDIQAQDRAHRIGQTKPVLIFRLVSKHTVEEKILEKANKKRQLEALVIAKGKFKTPTSASSRGKQETMAELAASLLKLEGEKIEVVPNSEAGKAGIISDEELNMLLDRSPETFADRGKGWTSKDGEQKEQAAFKVYDGPVDEGNDALARVMGESEEC